MAIDAHSPWSVARDPELLNVEQAEHPIYNCRPAGRSGPPITIYHQSFAKLKAALQDPTMVVDEDREHRLKNIVKLHLAATDIYYSEEERRKKVIPILERLLDIDLVRQRTVYVGKRPVTLDAIAEEAVYGAEMKAVIALFKFKNEFGGGDCGLQTALGLRKYLALDAVCIFLSVVTSSSDHLSCTVRVNPECFVLSLHHRVRRWPVHKLWWSYFGGHLHRRTVY